MDEPVILSGADKAGALQVTLLAQVAVTFYPDGFGNVENYIKRIGKDDPLFFRFTVDQLAAKVRAALG